MRTCLPALLLFCLVIPVADAQTPSIAQVTPQGLAPGKTTRIKIAGSHLGGPKQLVASFPGVLKPAADAEQKDNELVYDVTIPDNVPNGIHGLRVLADKGVSPLAFVTVDSLPAVAHSNQNKSPESAQTIPAACAVEGHVDNLARLYFRFPGKADQPFSLEVQARRIGSPLDPAVRLFAPNGREIAWSDDEPGLQGDCWLRTTLPADGDYLIELSDIRYSGSGNHRFRLRIGNFALINSTYPLIVPQEKGAAFSLTGPAVPEQVSASLGDDPLNAVTAFAQLYHRDPVWMIPALAAANDRPQLSDAMWPAVGFSNQPQIRETEPNNSDEQSQRVELGAGLNGRFDQPDDVDRFRFAAKKGQKYTFDALTRQAGSPTDLVMQILKPDGNQLATVEDDGLTDGRMDVTFPDDGDYTLVLRDLHRRGGPEFAWHVSVYETRPSFTLTAAEDTLNVPAGGTLAVQVNAQRRGYGGPIQLSADMLPEGITSLPTVIGPGRNDAILTLRASQDAGTESIGAPPRIIGTADINGETFSAEASLNDHLKASYNNLPWPSRHLIHAYAAAVTAPAPIDLRVEPAEVVFGQNLSAKVKVIAERTEGWDADIALAVNPAKNGLPDGISVNAQPIKQGSNEVELTFSANDKAAPGDFTAVLSGTIKKDKETSVQPTPGITLKLQAPLTIAVEPQGGKLAKGGELKLKATVNRNPALSAPVTVTAVNLPKGVTAEAVTIPPDRSSAEFVLKAAADAAAADVKNLQLKAEAKAGDKTFSVTSGNLPLTVE